MARSKSKLKNQKVSFVEAPPRRMMASKACKKAPDKTGDFKSESENSSPDQSRMNREKIENKEKTKETNRMNSRQELEMQKMQRSRSAEPNSFEEDINSKRSFKQFSENNDILRFDAEEEEKDPLDELKQMDETFRKIKKSNSGRAEDVSRDFKTRSSKEKQEEQRGQTRDDAWLKEYEIEKVQAPWMSKGTARVKNTLVRFHNEIIDFMNFVAPSKDEHLKREEAFARLSKTLLECVPSAKILPFGSFATKMYLPHADIDLVVLEPNSQPNSLMNKLAKVLMKHPDYESINIIRSAKVPLIKLIESKTGYNFDISFNKLDGVKQIKEINKALEYYPEMRYVLVLMKCFLKQRDLNETYTGGIGSFLLFCLVLTFLREIRRDFISAKKEEEIPNILLSEYVMKFLDFYANFDLQNKQILIAEGGAVVEKYIKEYALSVISPQEATHDVGGAAFKIKEISLPFQLQFQRRRVDPQIFSKCRVNLRAKDKSETLRLIGEMNVHK